jgi:hypothetical protein
MAVRGVSTGEVLLKLSTLKRSNGKLLFGFGYVKNKKPAGFAPLTGVSTLI